MRPNELEYFMNIARLVATRSTCLRRKVGAIAVKNRHIIATGYNGVPSKMQHCSEVGCLREQLNVPSGGQLDICSAVHAEQNVIIQAAYHGVSIKGATIYCTTMPCAICMKMLINCGITKIFYGEDYDSKETKSLALKASIPLIKTL